MAGITLAWLLGETVIVWRSVGKHHRPPMPGELLGSSVFFALLAGLAEYQPARTTATLMAFGVVLAAWLEAPLVTTGKTGTLTAAAPKATTTKTAAATGG